MLIVLLTSSQITQAQSTPTAPAPNALLVYDGTTVTLINTSSDKLVLEGLVLWKAGGSVKYRMDTLGDKLASGECIQLWTSAIQKPPLPPECKKQAAFFQTPRKELHFWLGNAENETFRPLFNSKALAICTASFNKAAGRCPFYLPQGDDQANPIVILDPVSKQPLPEGLLAAYDQTQLWLGNFTPNTILPTKGDLRLEYFDAGSKTPAGTWRPADATWDAPGFDLRALKNGECFVLYTDSSKVTPLLPCTTIVGKSVQKDAFWLRAFQILGPREDRPGSCNDGQPVTGPVLCQIAA